MPVPYSDNNNDSSGTAGYLKFLPDAAKGVWLGALFVMNERGEPVEFTHARLRSPNPLLWRPDDLRARCLESLVKSIFEICPVLPDLIFCLADEVDLGLFTEHIRSEIPIGRVAKDEAELNIVVKWNSEPDPDSTPGRLYKRLSARGLLLEPFERTEAGLREVYSELLRR